MAKRVGSVVQAARAERLWSQQRLAERAGTSQQWISRVERGEVDLRLSRVERLMGVLGRRVVLESADIPETTSADPDIVDRVEAAKLLTFFGFACGILWRRLDSVPFVVAGRLAALAQGMLVRPTRVDLRIAASDVPAASRALSTLMMPRWHDRLQMYVGHDPFLDGPGPRRWFAAGMTEMRVEIVPSIETGLTVTVEERALPVVPLGELLISDADIADLRSRVASSPSGTTGSGQSIE